MAKNANGAGSIVYEPDRKKYRVYIVTPEGRRITKRFTQWKEANAWLSLTKASVVNKTFVEPSDITLGSWLVSYLRDYKAQNIAPKTMDLYTLLASKCAPIADEKLQHISARSLQGFYTELLGTQSVEMVRKVHRFLHAAFEKARRIGVITTNVIDLAEPPKRTDKKEIAVFTPEEISKVYAAAKEYSGGRYYPFIMLAFATGARLGELLALFWDCVDFEKDEITIKRNLTVSVAAGTQIGPPKTKSGVRTISVPHTVLQLLKDLQHASDVLRVAGPVFVTRNGTPFSPRNITHAWANIIKLSGVSHKNFHSIRHTHATELLAAGAPIADVSRRIGHSRISHTLDLYGHAIPRMDKDISQKVSLLFTNK